MSYDLYLRANEQEPLSAAGETVISKYMVSYSQIYHKNLSIRHRAITKHVNILANASHTLMQIR